MSQEILTIKNELMRVGLYDDVGNIIVSYISCQKHNCLFEYVYSSGVNMCCECLEDLQMDLSDSFFSMQSEKEKRRIRMLFE